MTLKKAIPYSLDELIARALAIWGIDKRDLLGERRYQFLTYRRFAIMFVARELGYSQGAIGNALARDRTSILSGLNKAERLLVENQEFRKFVNQLRSFAHNSTSKENNWQEKRSAQLQNALSRLAAQNPSAFDWLYENLVARGE